VVVGIDYFFGDPVHLHVEDPGFDRKHWRDKSWKNAVEAVPKWSKSVREMFGADPKYCAVGE